MPIQQALQLAYAQEQKRSCRLDGRGGSDQIIGQHLLTVLRREQALLLLALRRDGGLEIRPRRTANSLQVFFRQARRFFGLVG